MGRKPGSPALRAASLIFLVTLLSGCPAADAPAPEELREPAPGHALAWTLGTWTGVRRDGASGDEAPMVLEVRSILGGAGTVHELRIGEPPDLYEGFAVQVPAGDAGRWVRHYTNASRGDFSRLEGEVTLSGSTWQVIGSRSGRLSRLESLRTPEGSWIRTMRVSEDEGATWRVLWSDRLSRTRES